MKKKHTLLFNRKVLGRGMVQRFFRRLAVFDMEDLKFRTNELADFVEKASAA
jgi:phospholipase/carboxylesterase